MKTKITVLSSLIIFLALIVALALKPKMFLKLMITKSSEKETEQILFEPAEERAGTEEDPGAASEFRYEMVTGSMENVDPLLMRNKAIEFTEKQMMSLESDNSAGSWVSKGPSNIAGRIRSIVINPSNTNIMLCGAVSGGIWKSTNAGVSWSPKLDAGNPISIGSMIIDPSNTNIVYAGTGEGWVDLYGGGIYKSTNFGDTWTLLSSTSGANASKFRNVKKMTSEPNGTIYAATIDDRYKDGVYNFSYDGGLYKSTNQGNNWTKISSNDVNTNYYNPNDVVAINSNLIIYAVGSFYYNQGIYLTNNGGANWTHITSGLPASGYERIALAKDPQNSNIIYAAIQSTDNSQNGDAGLKGIYKSTDYGFNWNVLPRPPMLVSTGNMSYMRDQGWYDNVIAVDPFNSAEIYLGGVELMKSIDGGNTWYQITYWDSYYGTPVVHADKHVIVFDPILPGLIYCGSDGGIDRTYNFGTNWEKRSGQLQVTQFYSGAAFPRGEIIYGGTQDNGQLRKISSGLVWGQVYGGDGGYSAQHSSDPNISYEEYVFMDMRKTTDQGQTWNDCVNGLIDANTQWSLFIAPFTMNPENSEVLAAGSVRFWLTIDGASNWYCMSNQFSQYGYVSAVSIMNSANNTFLGIAGTTDGKIFKCNALDFYQGTNNSWTDITPPVNNGAWVRRITIDPKDKNKIYACYSGYNPSGTLNSRHIFYSGNQGSTWSDISLNLPNVPVHTLVIDTTTGSTSLYAGTETGVYTSSDNGNTWSIFNTGMPSYVPVDQLVIQEDSRQLLAFTYGRGVYGVLLDNSYQMMTSLMTIEGMYDPSDNRMNRKDTVTLIVHSNTPPYNSIDYSKAKLDSVSCRAEFVFKNVSPGNYYISAKHRNSIEVWSATSFNMNGGFNNPIWSFLNIGSVYAGNERQVDTSPLRYGMFSGDINQDGSIDVSDLIEIYNAMNAYASGYIPTDLNYDELTDVTDLLMAYNNALNLVSVVTP